MVDHTFDQQLGFRAWDQNIPRDAKRQREKLLLLHEIGDRLTPRRPPDPLPKSTQPGFVEHLVKPRIQIDPPTPRRVGQQHLARQPRVLDLMAGQVVRGPLE